MQIFLADLAGLPGLTTGNTFAKFLLPFLRKLLFLIKAFDELQGKVGTIISGKLQNFIHNPADRDHDDSLNAFRTVVLSLFWLSLRHFLEPINKPHPGDWLATSHLPYAPDKAPGETVPGDS